MSIKMRKAGWGVLIIAALMASCKVNFHTPLAEGNPYELTTEQQLGDTKYSQEIESFYAGGTEGFFSGKADVPIYYKVFLQPEAGSPAILISSGRTEAAVKYKELVFDLYRRGYSVYIHDHRGQGQSGRMTGDPDMGYVDTFQFYIDDMKYFFEHMLEPANHERRYLLAHSMGGAIGMTYLEQHPADFTAAAFTSPMLGLGATTCMAAKVLSGRKPRYAPGQGTYEEERTAFEKNTLTGSEIRYNRMTEAFAAQPAARLGGASIQWVERSCRQFRYMNRHIRDIHTPFILFSAENEEIVNPRAHRKFIDQAGKMGKTCDAFLVEDARHELLIEKDKPRTETLGLVLDFFDRYK